MTDEELDSLILRFEQAWQLHGQPGIRDYLGELSSAGKAERFRLLIEMITIDLEYRWRSPGAVGRKDLASYIEEFPELVALDRLPLELIGEAYRARHRWGDRPSHLEFLAPFRERGQQLEAELLQVDREIEEEADEPQRTARPARTTPPSDPHAAAEPGMPLLSHRDFHQT